jgi:hypothetical protein
MMVDLIVENGRIHTGDRRLRRSGRGVFTHRRDGWQNDGTGLSGPCVLLGRNRSGGRCGMNAKMRMGAVAAVVIAALAGCGSPARVGAAGHSSPAHPACPQGSPYPPGVAGEVDYTDSFSHDSVSYEYFPSVPITASQTGSVLTRIQCSMSTYPATRTVPSHMPDDTATALRAGTPVYPVKGFSPRCRLAAYVDGQPRTYVAVTPTKHGSVPRACAEVAAQ